MTYAQIQAAIAALEKAEARRKLLSSTFAAHASLQSVKLSIIRIELETLRRKLDGLDLEETAAAVIAPH